MSVVHIVATGGTFDKTYDVLRERMVFPEISCIPRILADAYADLCATFECLMLVDSLDMRDSDRNKIVSAIEGSDAGRVLIVHGTSRIVDTGMYLAPLFPERTIVLTGALKPFAYSSTEAAFNLGCALCAARILGCGTFVAIHGNVIPIELAEKHPETGLFGCKEADAGGVRS